FGKNKSRKDGLMNYCKSCNNAKTKAWRKTNPDKAKSIDRLRYEANTDKRKALSAAYQKANPDKIRERKKAHYEANPEKAKFASKSWQKANPGKKNAREAKRYAKKLQATPPWSTKEMFEEIQLFYIEAASLTKETGIPH